MRSGKHGGVTEVTVYTQRFCGCCSEARRVLRRNGIPFREVGSRAGGGRDGLRARFGERSMTYPQIVIDGVHVGGLSDLLALEASGALDSLAGPSVKSRSSS